MYFKLAFSTAVLGMATIALAGYANTDVTNDSQHLSDIQAHSCPALASDSPTAAFGSAQQFPLLADENTENRLLALDAICSGYGYGGEWEAGSQQSDRPTAAFPESNPVPGSDRLIYFNSRPIPQTPQLTTEFDQLPQDRVELVEPL